MNDPDATNNLIVWGASSHALVVADIIRLGRLYTIIAFFDDRSSRETEFCGVPLLSKMEQLRTLHGQGTRNLIVAFGHCNARLRVAELARSEGFELATAIHPKALIAQGVQIGAGTVIVGGSVINPGTTIGENVIVNTGATVDHECVIEDGVHLGPGVHLGGRVHVGRASWVGIGAIIKDRVNVGRNSIVGAGSVVVEDIPENTISFGVPAKVIRNVRQDEN